MNGAFMENISIEQIIKVTPPKHAKTLKIAMIALSVLSLLFIFYIIGIVIIIVLVLATVIIFRYYDAEFEYTLVENELTIDRITAKSHRKRAGVYSLSRMEIMAPAGSDKLRTFENRQCKHYNYSSNTDVSKTYVIYAPSNNEMVGITIEPDEKLKDALWRISPSKVTL